MQGEKGGPAFRVSTSTPPPPPAPHAPLARTRNRLAAGRPCKLHRLSLCLRNTHDDQWPNCPIIGPIDPFCREYNIYIYIMSVCMYVCIYVCMYVCTYVHMLLCACIYIYICIYTANRDHLILQGTFLPYLRQGGGFCRLGRGVES